MQPQEMKVVICHTCVMYNHQIAVGAPSYLSILGFNPHERRCHLYHKTKINMDAKCFVKFLLLFKQYAQCTPVCYTVFVLAWMLFCIPANLTNQTFKSPCPMCWISILSPHFQYKSKICSGVVFFFFLSMCMSQCQLWTNFPLCIALKNEGI